MDGVRRVFNLPSPWLLFSEAFLWAFVNIYSGTKVLTVAVVVSAVYAREGNPSQIWGVLKPKSLNVCMKPL